MAMGLFHQHHEDQQAALITKLYVTTMQIGIVFIGDLWGIIMKGHEMDYRSSLVYIRLVPKPKPIADYHKLRSSRCGWSHLSSMAM